MRILLVICGFILTTSNCFSQLRFDYPINTFDSCIYIVSYELEYQEDSLYSDFKKKEVMYLLIGDSVHKFISKNFFIEDTIFRRMKSRDEFSAFCRTPAKYISRFGYQIFKNFPQGYLTHFERIMPNNYRYMEEMKFLEWKLHNETDSIHGYIVRKATCEYSGRSWVAWYSPDIPYSEGPYKFYGLPGLILDIHDTKNHYVFHFLSIEIPKEKLNIDMRGKEYHEISKTMFLKAEDNFRNNIGTIYKQAGISKENIEYAKSTIRVRNNPLELERD